MHALDVLGDPVRRRILELLADTRLPAGEIVSSIQAEFGITQSAVSQHLRVLRESGFATARAEGQRRIYALNPAPLIQIDQWLHPFRRYWDATLLSLKIAAEASPGEPLGSLSHEPADDKESVK